MLIDIILTSAFLSSAVSQSAPSSKESPAELCNTLCTCTEKDAVLYLNCEERNIDKMATIKLSLATPFHLNLYKNNLVELLPEDLGGLKNILSLNLGGNSIQQLEPGVFSALGFLKKLHINRNFLVTIKADTFQGLVNLEYLQADANFIRTIEPGAFSKLIRLKVLILNDNEISVLPSDIFRFVPLTHLDLRGNQLTSLAYVGLLEHIGRIMEFLLEDNYWECNCQILPLKIWRENLPAQSFVSEVICDSPPQFKGKTLNRVKKNDLCPSHGEISLEMPLKSSYIAVTPASKTSKNFPKLTNTEHVAKITRPSLVQVSGAICKELCSCFSSAAVEFLIHCEDKGIQTMSDLGLLDQSPTHLVLTGNMIRSLMLNDFATCESLQLLNLANNQIDSIDNGTFVSLGQLQKLYLNGNRLDELFTGMFAGLNNLEHLYLEYNIIETIQPATFTALTNLNTLYLNNNRLKTLPSHVFYQVPITKLNLMNNFFRQLYVFNVLDHLVSLRQIFLDNNPWDCTCSLLDFKKWIQTLNTNTVGGSILCQTPRKITKIELRALSHQTMCPDLAMFSPMPSKSASQAVPIEPTVAGGDMGFQQFFAHTLPLSVLILSVLVLFLLAVFSAAGLAALLVHRKQRLKKRKWELGQPKQSSTVTPQSNTTYQKNNNNSPLAQSPTTNARAEVTYGLTVKAFQSPTRCIQYKDRKLHQCRLSQSKCPHSCLQETEKGSDSSLPGRPLNFTIMKEYPSDFVALGDVALPYQNVFEREGELRQIDVTEYLKSNIPQLQSSSETGHKLNESPVYARHQTVSEYFDLGSGLHAGLDYLEVLERESTII